LNVEVTKTSVDLTIEVIRRPGCLLNMAMWIAGGLLAAA